MSGEKNNPLIKIAFITLLIGVMASLYFVMMSPSDDIDCTSACEKPTQATAPLTCTANSECEVRGKDEWESCEHIAAPRPPEQPSRSARDQTSKTQEGYSCGCVAQQCQYFRP